MFTDSHCHLAMTGERTGEMLKRARQAGVQGILVPGTGVEDGRDAISIASKNRNIWAAVGFHPHESKKCDATSFGEIEGLAADQSVVAIGEIGLDFHYNFSPPPVQREVFLKHLALANSRNLPVLIHNRESTADLMDLLETEEGRGARGVLHSFTESLEIAQKLVDRGFFISFSGILTFRNAGPLREVARKLPPDAVLIETDTPYLAPEPYRGRDNEPAFVVKIAELLATLWKVPLDEVGRITTGNFERAFGVSVTDDIS